MRQGQMGRHTPLKKNILALYVPFISTPFADNCLDIPLPDKKKAGFLLIFPGLVPVSF